MSIEQTLTDINPRTAYERDELFKAALRIADDFVDSETAEEICNAIIEWDEKR